MKLSPYRSEKVRFKCGETHVMLNTRSYEVSKKIYDCDLFGCGLQAVTMEINPFRDDDMYQVCLSNSSISHCAIPSFSADSGAVFFLSATHCFGLLSFH
jgi:hypothetical protein